jgi:hypothetical protein
MFRSSIQQDWHTGYMPYKRSYNPISSSAVSLKRLALYRKVRLNGKEKTTLYNLISPVNEKDFLNALQTINPAIEIQVGGKTGWWRFGDWDI